MLVVFAWRCCCCVRPGCCGTRTCKPSRSGPWPGTSCRRIFRGVAASSRWASDGASRRARRSWSSPSPSSTCTAVGHGHKVTVIPNWAPLDEIYPLERDNDWAVEQGLDDAQTLLYSGTLGLKHDPALLVVAGRQVIGAGRRSGWSWSTRDRLELLREAAAARRTVDAAALPAVRATLRRARHRRHPGRAARAGRRRVLGALQDPVLPVRRRPVLGLMPAENLAASLVERAGGFVAPGLDLAAARRPSGPTTARRLPRRAASVPARGCSPRRSSLWAVRQRVRGGPDVGAATR